MSETSNKFNHDNFINTVIEAPVTPGGTPPNHEKPEEPKKPSHTRRNIILGGATVVAAGAALAASHYIGLHSDSDTKGESVDNATTKTSAPVNSSTPNASEGATATPTNAAETDPNAPWYETINVDPTPEDIVIRTADTKPEDLPKVFITDRETAWLNAGYSKKFAEGIKSDSSFEADANARAASYDQLFKDNLLVKNPQFTNDTYISKTESIHSDDLYFASHTSFPEMSRADKVPYMRGTKLVNFSDLKVEDNGTVTFTATETEYDNADENSVGESLTNGTSLEEGQEVTSNYTFVVDNGEYKLADIEFVSDK